MRNTLEGGRHLLAAEALLGIEQLQQAKVPWHKAGNNNNLHLLLISSSESLHSTHCPQPFLLLVPLSLLLLLLVPTRLWFPPPTQS